MPNRLSREKSPYLLQHADNPVDWYAWGPEAFDRARQEDKPLFLSVGYATCHWCHVMAHESFEDEEVARELNRHYVSIKVDREERPDVDQVYMAACQALTGRGGWPLTVLMTPEGKPFFSGTYYPKRNKMGMPGLLNILEHFAERWRSNRALLLQAAEDITRAIQPREIAADGDREAGIGILEEAYKQHAQAFDPTWGGFGRAPKFPSPHHLNFLLRRHWRAPDSQALPMVEKTLTAMRRGGMFDHIGYGFHRYSVDEQWLVPHFEKMLYDQALLALAYIEAYQVTGRDAYADVVHEIFTYVLRDMTSPEGGFWSAEDADSEGREGAFYVWTPDSVKKELGDELGSLFCSYYDINEAGNFEHGESIPHVTKDIDQFARMKKIDPADVKNRLEQARQVLFQVRDLRPHPLKDDKILTSWNGLMIAALARGARVLDRPEYARTAGRAADFVLKELTEGRDRLMRRFRHGESAHSGYLEDYAYLVWGLIELYEAVFNLDYLERALELNQAMIDLFHDSDQGGFYFSGKENENLITRSKDIYDGAQPSGNGVAALNLLRLARLTGRSDLEEKADQTVQAFLGQVARYPMGHTHFLMALDFALGPGLEIVVSGDPDQEDTRAMIRKIHQSFMPNRVLTVKGKPEETNRLVNLAPYTADMPFQDRPVVYICQNFACRAPISTLDELDAALEEESGVKRKV